MKLKISKLCFAILYTTILMLALQLIFKIPQVNHYFSIEILDEGASSYITWGLVGFLVFAVTFVPMPFVPIMAFCNSTAMVASGNGIIDLFSFKTLLFCVFISIFITIGRILLYWICRFFGTKACEWINVDTHKYDMWCKRLSTKKWKALYAITGCVPFFPDGYVSIACGVVKFNFVWYVVSGFISKIVKIFIYLLLMRIPGLSFLFNASATSSSWTMVYVYSGINILLLFFGILFSKLAKRDALKYYDIEIAKLNGKKYWRITLDRTLYIPTVQMTNGKSAWTYAQRTYFPVVCNAGLFNVKTKYPLGQLVINRMDMSVEDMVRDDNSHPISDKECYPLLIDAMGNMKTYQNRHSSENKISNILNTCEYAVCGFGTILENGKDAELYDNEIRWANKRKKRQVIGIDKDDNYFIISFASASYREIYDMLSKENAKFAYCLDGGRSTELVVAGYQINPVYIGLHGRKISNVIAFEIRQD